MKICIYGDSIAAGTYLENNWANLLRDYLKTVIKEDVKINNHAANGNTSGNIIAELSGPYTKEHQDIAMLAYGINDSGYILKGSRCIEITDLKTFSENTKNIITNIRNNTNKIIFVGLVLGNDSLLKPYSENGSEKRIYDIDRSKIYDKHLQKIAMENNCTYIKLMNSLEYSDFIEGLHPNESGHLKMFGVIKEFIDKDLKIQ